MFTCVHAKLSEGFVWLHGDLSGSCMIWGSQGFEIMLGVCPKYGRDSSLEHIRPGAAVRLVSCNLSCALVLADMHLDISGLVPGMAWQYLRTLLTNSSVLLSFLHMWRCIKLKSTLALRVLI